MRIAMNHAAIRTVVFLISGTILSQFADSADPSHYLPSGGQHRLFSADMPAGVIGGARAVGRGPIADFYQPVKFSGPAGAKFSLALGGEFQPAQPTPMAGLAIGRVYRFRISEIAGHPGAELYPTIEMIDRTYAPTALATSYPVPINLDEEDLRQALRGRLVTRVIYLEDPQTALAIPETPQTSRAMDISVHQDALEVADRFGRPVAIVRIGSLTPPTAPALIPQFFFGHPSWAPIFQPEQATQE